MVDLRKWLLALAVIALALSAVTPASAQQPPPFQCVANAGVPPLIRSQGLTELLGDIVLNCTGGTPNDTNTQVPPVNFQVFLNTNVTSRLIGDPYTDALLLVDEPGSAANPAPQLVCGTATAPQNPALLNGTCTMFGTRTPGGAPLVEQVNAVYNGTPGRPNIFVGRTNGANSIAFLGVPVDPPGTVATRTFRITNLRGNANLLGTSSSLLPTQVVANISASGAFVVPINNPQQIIGFVLNGLNVSVREPDGDAIAVATRRKLQCVTENNDIVTDPTDTDSCPHARLRYEEGFANSFKTQLTQSNQGIPGAVFTGAESGFYNPNISSSTTTLTNVTFDPRRAGLADHGTRLRAFFNNIPRDVLIYVSTVSLTTGNSAAGNAAQLVTTAADGSGAFSPTPSTGRNRNADNSGGCLLSTSPGGPRDANGSNLGITHAPILITNGQGVAVWEITANDPSQIGRVEFFVTLAYRANTSAGSPGLGDGTVSMSFAPVSTVGTASATAPIPRFADTSTPIVLFNLISCETNLLFPFVTNQAGFDTGLVISNTSQDPYGTTSQTGACTLNYYGNTSGGAAPPAQTTSAVPAGAHLIGTLMAGGNFGLTATPGFQGYIIARCLFQYAHGFAFISDVGANRLAMGYLALILDEAIGDRTNNQSESLGQ